MGLMEELKKTVVNDVSAKKFYEIESKQYKLNLLLREIRTEKNITQAEIARKTGLSKQMVSKMEKYNGNPTLSSFIKYCDCIGIDLVEVIRGAEKTGHWVESPTGRGMFTCGGNPVYECSECGYVYGSFEIYPSAKYCRDCGVRMVKPNEKE